jgi:hypothetical protein
MHGLQQGMYIYCSTYIYMTHTCRISSVTAGILYFYVPGAASKLYRCNLYRVKLVFSVADPETPSRAVRFMTLRKLRKLYVRGGALRPAVRVRQARHPSGPARGVYAPFAFSRVNRFPMGVFEWACRVLTSRKWRLPAREVVLPMASLMEAAGLTSLDQKLETVSCHPRSTLVPVF